MDAAASWVRRFAFGLALVGLCLPVGYVWQCRVPMVCYALSADDASFPVDLPPRANPIPPPDGGCYLGAYVGSEPESMVALDQQTGRTHALFLKFIAVGDDTFYQGAASSVASFCAACYGLGAVPYLTLQPARANAAALLTPSDVSWMEQFASDIGALKRPVFIRFAHEMNGDWYPWGWRHVSPVVYIAGFREVAAIFRERAPKAAMVWAPSQDWGDNCDHTYSNWYPGDSCVDWVGLTSYQWPFGGLSANQFYYSITSGEQPEPDFYQTFAVGHDKPMMIAETSCGDDDSGYHETTAQAAAYGTDAGQGPQNWWIPQVYGLSGPFSVAHSFPRIHAITWFDCNVDGADFRLGGSDPSRNSTGSSAYSRYVADPFWLSDALPPVTVASGTLGTWTNRAISLELDATDGPNGSGVGHTFFAEDGASTCNTTMFAAPVTISAEGTTVVKFWSVDSAGNAEEPSTATALLDVSPPSTCDDHVPISVPPATVHLRATDALSGVSATTWTLDGIVGRGTVVTTGEDGEHVLVYASSDNAGNREVSHEVTFVVGVETSLRMLSQPVVGTAYGQPVALAGELEASLPVGEKQIELESSADGNRYSRAATITTTEDGVFRFSVTPVRATSYRFRFTGGGALLPSAPTQAVTVTPCAWLQAPLAPSSVTRFRAFTASGLLKPRHPAGACSVFVVLYRRRDAGWQRWGRVPAYLSDRGKYMRYVALVRLPRAGEWRLRAYAAPDADHAASWSAASSQVVVR